MNLPDPAACDEATLARFAADLALPRLEGEPLDAWRARVVAAFEDDATIDRAVPTPTAGGFTLGGHILGS